MHEQAQGVGMRLGISAEHHQAVQRGAKHAVEVFNHAGVAQVVLANRLRRLFGVEALCLQEGAHGAEIDVVDHGRRDDLSLLHLGSRQIESPASGAAA